MSQGRRRSPLPPNWPQIRRDVLERDSHTCRVRLSGCLVHATEVHHTRSHDDHSSEALIAACTSCHARVTGKDAAQIRQRKYDRRRPRPTHPGTIPGPSTQKGGG